MTASSTICASTGAVASSCGMFAVLAATAGATSSRPSTDVSMLLTDLMRSIKRAPRPAPRPARCRARYPSSRGSTALRPSLPDGHLPERPGGVQDAHPRVVDARDAAELTRLVAYDADGLLGRGRLLRDAGGEHDDRDHDHGSNRDHN